MKAVIQRVQEAQVVIEEKVRGKIQHGMLIYICFEATDTYEQMDTLINKIVNLRIFEDDKSRMNKNIIDAQGSILSISQFTLSWDGKKGHRPSFDKSMAPNNAKVFYKRFNDELKLKGIPLEMGIFGADMKVSSTNDGPVTFFLDF